MAFMASWITFSEEKILKSALSSQLSVLSSQFSVLGSRFSVLGSRFSVLGSQFSVLSSQFSVLSSQFSEKRTLRGTGCQRSWRKAFDLTENWELRTAVRPLLHWHVLARSPSSWLKRSLRLSPTTRVSIRSFTFS